MRRPWLAALLVVGVTLASCPVSALAQQGHGPGQGRPPAGGGGTGGPPPGGGGGYHGGPGYRPGGPGYPGGPAYRPGYPGGPYHRPYYRPYGYGGYYRPYYPYYPYYSPFYFGFGMYGWYPYAWGYGAYPGPWVYGAYDDSSAIKFEVTPRETEIYVDGYRAGIVDDFDGFFQRMRLRPGAHDIVLYLDGYRTVRQSLQLTVGGDVKVKHTMVPLAPGEANELRPEPPPTPPQQDRDPAAEFFGAPVPPPASTTAVPEGFGAVSVRVQPADAEVWIDGERWSGPDTGGPLVVQLAPGSHRVEIRRDGYVPYSTVVEVQARRATPINVSLPPER